MLTSTQLSHKDSHFSNEAPKSMGLLKKEQKNNNNIKSNSRHIVEFEKSQMNYI